MKTITTFLLNLILLFGYAQDSTWINFTSTTKIYSLTTEGSKLWATTVGGCVSIDENTGNTERFTRANAGFADVFINSMFIEPNGTKWFQSYQYGITKFDGVNWTTYDLSNSNIPDQNVSNIRVDQSGNVWMISMNEKGLIKFDGMNWTHFNSTNSNLPYGNFRKFEFDETGDIWIITSNLGLIKFNETNTTIYTTSNSSIPSNSANDLLFDADGSIWLSFQNAGISKFDGTNWTFYTTSNSDIPSNNISSLTSYNTIIWGVYNDQTDGIFKFENLNWTNYNSLNSTIPAGEIYALKITSNGDKWMIIDGNPTYKLIQFDDVSIIDHNISNSPLGGSIITDIDKDESGKMIISSSGEYIYDGQMLTFKNNQWESRTYLTSVNWIEKQNDSTTWLGLYNRIGKDVNGVVSILDTTNSGLPSQVVTNAAIDTNGNVWFSTHNGLVHYDGNNWIVYDTSNSEIQTNRLIDIVIDHQNTIWLATEDSAGLIKFDGLNWTSFNTSNSTIPTNYLRNLKIDRNGGLWIVNHFEGVVKFDGNNFELYNSSNTSLPIDDCYSIGFDHNNNLWLGCWEGAAFFNGLDWEMLTRQNSRLPHNHVLDIEFDDYGNVWFGTAGGGIGIFNPEGVVLNVVENNLNVNGYTVKIYPIPFQSNFTIEIEPRLIGSTIYFFDFNGRVLKSETLNQLSTNLNLNSYNSEIYFYQIVSNNSILKKGKLMKQ